MPPNINRSYAEFTVLEDCLLYGLESVKYVGGAAVEEIVECRPFESVEDFRAKVQRKKCNKRALDNLIMAGAFDELGYRDDWTVEERRRTELESMGVAISGTGESEKYAKIIDERINPEEDLERIAEGGPVVLGGEITAIKHHTIKSGKNKGALMGYVDVTYKDNIWSCTMFRSVYEQYLDLLKDGSVVMVRGRKGERGDILVDQMIEIKELEKALNVV
jgi:DNA polymerase III alpha subunit